jgi:hypothetical protein
MAKQPSKLTVVALKHDEARRKNIPTAEYLSVMTSNRHSTARFSIHIRLDMHRKACFPMHVVQGEGAS